MSTTSDINVMTFNIQKIWRQERGIEKTVRYMWIQIRAISISDKIQPTRKTTS